jgi:hypothetical protein
MNPPILSPQVNPPPATVVTPATADASLAPIPCAQVWSLLTPAQQQAVRQAFVQVCRHIAGAVERRSAPDEEASHEPA